MVIAAATGGIDSTKLLYVSNQTAQQQLPSPTQALAKTCPAHVLNEVPLLHHDKVNLLFQQATSLGYTESPS